MKLGDCLLMIKNGAVISQIKDAGGIPITRIETLSNNRFNRDRLGYANIFDSSDWEDYILDDKDILMSHINSKDFVGRSVLYEKDSDEKIIHGMNLLRIKTNPEISHPIFAYYWFQSPYFKKSIYSIRKDAVNQSSVSISDIKQLEINLPSIEVQIKIAKALYSLDHQISINNKMYNSLETMAKLVFDYWFVQFDFPNPNGDPYKSSGGRMVYNDLLKRDIPENWEVKYFGDYVNFIRGLSYSKENLSTTGRPMISLASFSPSSTYKVDSIKYYDGTTSENDYLTPFDILLCTTQQTAIDNKTDIVGKTIYVPDIFEEFSVMTTDLLKIEVDKCIGSIILYETKEPWYNKYITGFASGTSIKHLDINGFLAYPFALPPIDLCTTFFKLVNSVQRRQSLLLKHNNSLTQLRDYLLPLLLNGQIKL